MVRHHGMNDKKKVGLKKPASPPKKITSICLSPPVGPSHPCPGRPRMEPTGILCPEKKLSAFHFARAEDGWRPIELPSPACVSRTSSIVAEFIRLGAKLLEIDVLFRMIPPKREYGNSVRSLPSPYGDFLEFPLSPCRASSSPMRLP